MNTYVKQKRVARRRAKVKKCLIRWLILAVLVGLVSGFFIGRVSATNDTEPILEVIPKVIPKETPKEEPAKVYYDCPLSKDLQDHIRTLCSQNDVPMDLVIAQIQVESGFRADCISATNDYGLMQINKINHKWLSEQYGITDFLDPYQNVLCGIKILSGHLKNCGSLEKALMSYNMGSGGADNLWKQGIHTTNYVQKVKSAMNNSQL